MSVGLNLSIGRRLVYYFLKENENYENASQCVRRPVSIALQRSHAIMSIVTASALLVQIGHWSLEDGPPVVRRERYGAIRYLFNTVRLLIAE